MHIVIAPDAFKGSLSAARAAEIMGAAAKGASTTHTTTLKPMADGGEGTLDAILLAEQGTQIEIECQNALGDRITAPYGIIGGDTAIIECAAIAGLPQVPAAQRNPDITTTYGIGEAIIDALDKGCTRIIVALGGSATNDGGLGMLMALGLVAYDSDQVRVGALGRDVAAVRRVDVTNLDPRLAHIEIHIASDVDNPLCGKRGATAVFGPQKGVEPDQVGHYDNALHQFALLVEAEIHQEVKDVAGAGAAGGLGFALLALGAEMASGAALVAETIELEDAVRRADVVLTGEGQSDAQTLYGKAPGYVAAVARECGVPVVLISGSLGGDRADLLAAFSGCFSIIDRPLSLEACMTQAGDLLYEQTKQVVHMLGCVGRAFKGN